jgi:hypothetical protein
MKKLSLIIILLFSHQTIFTQNWQQVGDLNVDIRTFYSDTVTNFLYGTASAKYNGTDTIGGIFYFDGQDIHGIGQQASHCGEPACGPATLRRFRDKMYVLSNINSIGGVVTNAMAGWDGSHWSPVSGLYNHSLSGDTTGFAFGGFVENDSSMLVSGIFLKAGQDTCYSLARWNGTTWKGIRFFPFWGGDPMFLHHVIVYKGQIYVAGNLVTETNGETLVRIARYDEATGWHAVGAGVGGSFSSIYDMKIFRDELYICGNFTKGGLTIGQNIMRWNGTEWQEVGGGLCGSSTVTCMHVYKDKLYIGGLFGCIGTDGIPANSLAVWDGDTWCTVGDNQVFDNKIADIVFYKDTLYVGGGFTKIGGETMRFFVKYMGDATGSVCTTSSTGSPQSSSVSVQLSPIPSNSTVTASFGSTRYEHWQLHRCTDGRLVASSQIPGADTLQIDVSQLPPGIYVLSVQLDTGRQWVGKVVVAR